MSDYKIDAEKMENIINKVVDAVNTSKEEIYEIAEGARRECKFIENELIFLKKEVKGLIIEVDSLECQLKESRQKLMLVSKNHDKYSEQEIKDTYELADNLRITLAVKREKEQHLIQRRNDLELRLKESIRTVEKAENLISNVGVAMGYLSGDLQKLGKQIEGMHQKQMLGIRIIKAQEEERKRVAREIHDGPAQSMSNVVLKADICEKLVDMDIVKAKDELRNLKKIVRDSLQEVRKIIYDLRPMSLDDLGLVPTLQRYIATFQEETRINVIFKTRGNYSDTTSVVSLAIFRLVQEAVTNIRKYAKAQNVSVHFEALEDKINLSVIDDGKGFDLNELKTRNKDISSGFGILSMRERIKLLNGEFDITSEIGKGTRIRITIPLKQVEGEINE